MKAPQFWHNLNIVAYLLYPISLVYTFVAKLKYSLQTPIKFNKTIICVGNVILGGSGKTPVCIAIGELLKKHGYRIAYACKSYKLKPELYDEGLLLRKIAPTFVDKDRVKAITKAANTDVDFVIADDGLQNNRFFKDFSILVIDSQIGFGNGLIFPAGPMRESLDSGLMKSDLVVTIGNNTQCILKGFQDLARRTRVEHRSLSYYKRGAQIPEVRQRRSLKGEEYSQVKHIKATPVFQFNGNKAFRYLAFAGIAYPIKFFSSLKKKGINVIKKIEYSDHYRYSDHDIKKLIQQSNQLKARLVTTEKDLVKIPIKYHSKIDCLKIKLELQSGSTLLKMITRG